MRITTTQPLFAWECLDDSPSLRTIREFRDRQNGSGGAGAMET